MAQPGVEQRLAAILAADVAGYTRLMADDEAATLAALDAARAVFRDCVETERGRIVDTAGDSVLAVFATATGAVRAALAVQERLAVAEADVPERRRMRFRIGVNLGEVMEKSDGSVYGSGVNVAARLEALAEPGGVMVSEDVLRQAKDRLDAVFEDSGRHTVKNVGEPVHAFRVAPSGRAPARKPGRRRAQATIAAMLIIAAGLGAWWLTRAPLAPATLTAAGRPTADPVLAMPTGPSIAVLPFDNLSADPAQDFFADGLVEDIISALSRFGDLRVIARNSTFQYRGEATDVRKIGAALGAGYVLEGSVRRAGNTLRVTAQLLDARDGGHLWSKQFDRDLSASAVFDIQDAITVDVVTSIAGYNGAIARRWLSDVVGERTHDLAAYECVLVVYVSYDSVVSESNFNRARDCLEAAIARDPTYVDALAALSYVYGDGYSMGMTAGLENVDPIARSVELASRAVELNPKSGAAHRAMALAYFYRHELGDFVDHAERALAINPNDPQTLGQLGSYLVMMGQRERGAALIQKAYALNPDLPDWYNLSLAIARYMDNDFAAALAYADKVKDPYNYFVPEFRIVFLAELGRLDETRPHFDHLESLYPGFSIASAREENAVWNWPNEATDRWVASMRKAGFPEAPIQEASRPIIAVLPFDNLSGDAAQDYFAAGITEDVISRLSLFQQIGVIARSSTFQFAGDPVDVREMAEKLGASHLVVGSISRSSDRVRVRVQLIEAETGNHIWSESYDDSLTAGNIFEIQDKIAGRVASTIGDQHGIISRAAVQATWRQQPENLSSYDCVLKKYEYDRFISAESHLVALGCLERTVRRDSNYVDAWAALSEMYAESHMTGFNPVEAPIERALEAAKTAVSLDPTSQMAQWALAYAYFVARDKEKFVVNIDKAVVLNPNNAYLLGTAGWGLMLAGEWERGLTMIKEATELNPYHPGWWHYPIAIYRYHEGRYDEALNEAGKSGLPDFFWTPLMYAAVYARLGRDDEARNAAARVIELNPDFVNRPRSYIGAYVFSGDVIEEVIAGLREAGMNIADSATTD